MKSLVTISILAALGLGVVPAQSAAFVRSSDRTIAVYPTSTLVAHACRDYRRHRSWFAPHAGRYAWYGYGHRSWGKHHGRRGGHYGWHAHKRGHHGGKHHKGHRGGHYYRYR